MRLVMVYVCNRISYDNYVLRLHQNVLKKMYYKVIIMNDLDRIAIIIILIQRGILVPVSNIIYEKLRSYALLSLIEITEGKMTYQIYSWK